MPVLYEKDPYALLGVSFTASDAEIKRKYRRLAREYHPDLNKDPRAVERMKDINWAYSILGDSQKRANYDFLRRAAERGESTPGASATPPARGQPWTTYSSPRPRPPTRTASGGLGASAVFIFWAIYSLISSLLRSAPSSQPVYLSGYNAITQTAQMQRFENLIQTFVSTQQGSAQPFDSAPAIFATETLRPTQTPAGDPDDIQDQIVPGTKEWEWIDTLLAEYHLTTPSGLSDEVLRVRRDESGDIFVETRSHGAFFIYVGADAAPTVIPLSITPMP